MDDKKMGWKVLERAEAKNPTGAKRLFNKYCHPITRFWDDRERDLAKEAALKIFDSEFSIYIEENGLKGHARHKKTYPVDVGNLIIALIKYAHFDRRVNLPYLPRDLMRGMILKEFDDHLNESCEILQEGGVRTNRFKKEGQECRRKLSAQAAEGKISPYWREAVDEKIWPGHRYVPQRQQPHMFAACRFADVFLWHVPQAPTSRIVEWVNIILKALDRPSAVKSCLNGYISTAKKQPQISPEIPVEITE